MLKKFKTIKARLSNALKMQRNTPNIHIAFKQWIEQHPEYTNLVFQHGSNLFSRSINGEYNVLALRLAFSCFEVRKRGVTYRFWTRARRAFLASALVYGFVGACITALLFKAYGVF